MDGLLGRLLSVPLVNRTARRAAHSIDLQWMITVEGLREVAPLTRGKLLDVGCGDKPYVSIFEPYVDEYIGIERETTFGLTRASDRATGPDLYYDGKRLPFSDDSFDTVLNVQVLEHTPRPQELMDEMARVLKRDGLLIVAAPFAFRLHEEPHDYFRYSPHGLRDLCTRAGLEVTAVRAQGSLWSVIGHKLNSYLGFRVSALGGVLQTIGKLNHEAANQEAPRMWTVPFVLPAMGAITAGARVLDRVLPDETEALNFLILARRAPASGGTAG
jgi:SAM-dependent methyltransferase